MSQKNLIIFVVSSILVLLIAYSMKNSAQKEYMQSKQELTVFDKEVKELAALKKRFGNKKNIKRVIETLKRAVKPSSEKNRGATILYDFENLNNQKLNVLLRKIENSGIKVKELRITRTDPQNAKVSLEVFK